MKKYETPVLDVTELLKSDVITTSDGDTPPKDFAW